MGNHWPIVIAVLLVVAAVMFGLYQRDALEVSAQETSAPRSLSAAYIAFPDNPAPARAATPLPTLTQPLAPPITTVTAPVPPVLQAPVPIRAPAAAQQQVPAAAGQLNPISPGTTRGMAFTNLRSGLIQKFGTAPQATQNGGFAITADGVRVEVDSSADWSVALYNNNPANPAVQSENFKVALNQAIANLELDMSKQPQTTAEGKQTLRTSSNKVGLVSMVTDPAMGNSVSIKPIQRKVTTLTPKAPVAGQPAAPAQPVAPPGNPQPKVAKMPNKPIEPVLPPKAPVNEQF